MAGQPVPVLRRTHTDMANNDKLPATKAQKSALPAKEGFSVNANTPDTPPQEASSEGEGRQWVERAGGTGFSTPNGGECTGAQRPFASCCGGTPAEET